MKHEDHERLLRDSFGIPDTDVYSLVIQNLPMGFSLVDRTGVILEFNRMAQDLTGYSRDDVIGKSHFEIIHGAEDPGSCPLFAHVLKEHTPSLAAETALKTRSGETIVLLVTAFPIFDASGSFIGGVEFFRDISEIKRLERERKNLFSMFAHDMKSPLAGVSGLLQRLSSGKAGSLTDKQRDYLSTVMRSISRLQAMVSKFIEFSKMDTGRGDPVLGPYDIKAALGEQIEMMRLTAEKKDVRIVFEHSRGELPVVEADSAMIDRVLANLLDNAVKYTNTGGVVTVRLASDEKRVLVEVLDTGVGIRDQDMPCVFDAFCRVSRDSEGSGLGLSIARGIIEAHHGILSVESVPGKGSRFWFVIPRR
jgi:two-component system phosphate regulon sensor histidine kinase PhoR